MREEESNWFSKWEEELPSPDELMPLSQSLITPDLALAFDIRSPGGTTPISVLHRHQNHHHHNFLHQSSSAPPPAPLPYSSSELESSSGGGGADQEPARTLKRPRLVWTPQLHKRFVDAVAHLGIKNAVPKTIMQLMSVDGLTRENVASHLQKYRLYLKRMQGLNNGAAGAGGGVSGSGGDPATDHLFASSPVPAHFLARPGPPGGGRPNSEQFMPYMAPVAALHHQQMAMAQLQPHQLQRQLGQFGPGRQFEQSPFLSGQAQLGPGRNGMVQNSGYHVEDMESPTPNNGRKVLTLFPNADD